ncbi:MAG: YraN family protein, partial [Armatimonadota bacterium]
MLRRGWRSSNRDRRTTPSADKRWLGDKAEAAARSELRRRGYHIIAHNFRTRVGEIDIVARKGESLVFVEVRS